MQIYDKPGWVLMHEMADQLLRRPQDEITRSEVIAWFSERYPDLKLGTINAHLIRMSTNQASRVNHHGKLSGEDDLLFKLDRNRYRRYVVASDPPPIYGGRMR